jgi:3-phenylpropionate/trans-cinnamate dioxygenase ferredoxin subunit
VGDTERVSLGDLSNLAEGELRGCRAGDQSVAVCRVNGVLYAFEDECSHAETTLSDGDLDGYTVTCPLHFAQFDVRTGAHLCPPAYTGVATYPIEEDATGATVQVPTTKPRRDDAGFPSGGMFRTR